MISFGFPLCSVCHPFLVVAFIFCAPFGLGGGGNCGIFFDVGLFDAKWIWVFVVNLYRTSDLGGIKMRQ